LTTAGECKTWDAVCPGSALVDVALWAKAGYEDPSTVPQTCTHTLANAYDTTKVAACKLLAKQACYDSTDCDWNIDCRNNFGAADAVNTIMPKVCPTELPTCSGYTDESTFGFCMKASVVTAAACTHHTRFGNRIESVVQCESLLESDCMTDTKRYS
jgi:hypothetical protein